MLVKQLQPDWKPGKFTVDAVHLISRKGKADSADGADSKQRQGDSKQVEEAFHIDYTIPLGAGAVVRHDPPIPYRCEGQGMKAARKTQLAAERKQVRSRCIVCDGVSCMSYAG